MSKNKEYQTGTMSASNFEDGKLSDWLSERSKSGWKLKSLKKYFSKRLNEDSFAWILERNV